MMLARLGLIARAWKHRVVKDPTEIGLLRSLLTAGDTCFDIGSHKCAYTYWMHRQVGTRGRVICFEPQEVYAKLARELWARTPSVRVEHRALSDREGGATLYVPSWGPSPGASLVAGNVAAGAKPVGVATTTLDAYCEAKGIEAVRLVKCDVEGHELSVLRGAARTLERSRPILMLECEARFGGSARVSEVFSLLRSFGYEGECITRAGLRPLASFSVERDQAAGSRHYINDFLFRHPETAAIGGRVAMP